MAKYCLKIILLLIILWGCGFMSGALYVYRHFPVELHIFYTGF